MSELWTGGVADNAARVPVWVRGGAMPSFTPWGSDLPEYADGHDSFGMSDRDHDPGHVTEPGDVRARAFTEGYEEGRRAVLEGVAAERDALAELARSLEALTPEPSRELGLLLAETVDRLVRQIVGEVTIDRETLEARAMAAAELISEEAGTMRLRLNPADAERLADAQLDVQMVPDAHLAPGTILLETGDGWVEDGPEVRLEKLRAALDRMGIAR
jgi:flagellar assembly protein FliH